MREGMGIRCGIARRWDRAYLMSVGAAGGSVAGEPELLLMPDTASTATSSRPLALLAGAGGIALAAAIALWAHYGTAVFFEMIAAGIAACF
jgi:hypothetical protein